MRFFLPPTGALAVPVEFAKDGAAFTAASGTFRILATDGTELQAAQAITFTDGPAAAATVSIPNAIASLAAGQIAKGLRLDFALTAESGDTAAMMEVIGIRAADPLVAATNSFQTLAQAEFEAAMLDVGTYAAADTDAKINALIAAWHAICGLKFRALRDSTRPENWPAGGLLNVDELDELGAEEFARLPTDFVAALRRAQVLEADALLGANDVLAKRNSGLVLETIGESKEMYRGDKPIDLAVSQRTLNALAKYLASWSVRLGRA